MFFVSRCRAWLASPNRSHKKSAILIKYEGRKELHKKLLIRVRRHPPDDNCKRSLSRQKLFTNYQMSLSVNFSFEVVFIHKYANLSLSKSMPRTASILWMKTNKRFYTTDHKLIAFSKSDVDSSPTRISTREETAARKRRRKTRCHSRQKLNGIDMWRVSVFLAILRDVFCLAPLAAEKQQVEPRLEAWCPLMDRAARRSLRS